MFEEDKILGCLTDQERQRYDFIHATLRDLSLNVYKDTVEGRDMNAILAEASDDEDEFIQNYSKEIASKRLDKFFNDVLVKPEYRTLVKEQGELKNTALKRYLDENKIDRSAVMTDAATVLKTYSPKNIEELLKKDKDLLGKAIINNRELIYSLIVADISGALHTHSRALDLLDESPDELFSLISDGADLYLATLSMLRYEEERTTKYPDESIRTRDKVTVTAFKGELGEEETKLITSSWGAKKELSALVSVSFDKAQSDKNITIYGGKDLNNYDEQVHSAILSLYIGGGNDIMNTTMIYRQMVGDKKARITDQHAKDIEKSIEKMSSLRVSIDTRNEQQGKGWGGLEYKYRENLIHTRTLTAKINNVIVHDCIQVLTLPVLYKYASGKNHITRIPPKLLDSPVNKTRETILLQAFLLARIDSIKNNEEGKGVITYQSIYDHLGIEDDKTTGTYIKMKRTRDQVKTILDHFKKEGYIRSHRNNPRKGNALISFTITVEQ